MTTIKNATDILVLFCTGNRNYKTWQRVEYGNRVGFATNLTKKQTDWFFGVYNKQLGNTGYGYQENAHGVINLEGRDMSYQIDTVRYGASVLKILEL